MNRSTLARRYAPLVAVVALQLLIIAVVPSTAPTTVAAGAGSGLTPDGVIAQPDGTFIDPTTGEIVDAQGNVISSGSGGTTPGGGTGTTTPGGGGPSTTLAASGDIKHCVNGRQYDPALYAYAPACVPKFKGENGGKTYLHGVTKDTIKVVVMRGNYGVVVNNALKAAGSLPADEEFNGFLTAAASFINSRYELYGRRVVMVPYQIKAGTGGQGSPEDDKLRIEMREMVKNEDPYAVIWSTSVSSATYEELSKLGVVNLGGYGFTDTFNQQWAPHHWDVQLGGNQLAQHVAEWWCSRMWGGGTAKAQYAGGDNPNSDQDLRLNNRTLGVISTDDVENKAVVLQLDSLIKTKCGSRIEHRYFYAQDVTTADTQRRLVVAEMKKAPIATTVMCFCDQVAPFFLYDQEEQERYYPENIFVGTGFTDLDSSVQTYDHQLSPQRPKDQYPEMENAFGLAQMGRQRAPDKNDAAAVWRATGKTGDPYATADAQGDWEYYAMLATLLQAAGPNLNPTSMMQAVQRQAPINPGGLGDQYRPGRSFGAGDFTWNDTMREVYWSPKGASEFNGVTGTWRSLNDGRWFRRGSYAQQLLALPPKPRG